MSNVHLNRAKKAKSDEWYTKYEDIASELPLYDLRGKAVYCNCDDPYKSQFVKFLREKYEEFELRGLLASGYNRLGQGYFYEYDGFNDVHDRLKYNGDFESPECQELMAESDVLITNPPFSLMRRYVEQTRRFGKDFILISPLFILSYKVLWDRLKAGEIFCGNAIHEFIRPDGEVEKALGIWISTMTPKYGLKKLDPKAEYSPERHPFYDNYDAIECARIDQMPKDYDGAMGVPTTIFMYDLSDYHVLGHARCLPKIYGTKASDISVQGRRVFNRIIIRRK